MKSKGKEYLTILLELIFMGVVWYAFSIALLSILGG